MSNHQLLLKLFIILLVILENTKAFNPCERPGGEPGDCKPINECPSLFVHNKSSKLTEYIRRSQCGFTQNYPKVCCPLPVEPELPPDSSFFVTSDLLPGTDVCGLSAPNKIVGGEKTDLDEFPWMALLDYDDPDGFGTKYFDCGGALINERYVLTAAHCVHANLVSVRLGEYNTNKEIDCIADDCAPPPLDIPIEEKIVFKSFDLKDDSSYHDIALLRLNQEVKFSDFIRPICLPTTVGEIFKSHLEENVTVAGWGNTENNRPSNFKLKVQVPVTKCRYSYYNNFDHGVICAGGEKGKDSCKGDSGGPLMSITRDDEKKEIHWYAIGVLSNGPFPCGERNVPAAYIKVSKYLYWIVDNLKP